jgi:hypothetical protein
MHTRSAQILKTLNACQMGSFAEKREGSLALSKIICIMKFLIIWPVNPTPLSPQSVVLLAI